VDQSESKRIMTRAGPKSIKRKWLQELGNSEEVGTSNLPEDDKIRHSFDQRLKKRFKAHVKTNPNTSSTSSSSDLSIGQNNSPPPLNVLTEEITVVSSPSSPSTEPTVSDYRRRLRSSNLSLNDGNSQNQQRTIASPPTPNSSPPLPAVVKRVSPRLRVNDGNAHSNTAAPRRVNTNLTPGIHTPVIGTSGRDARRNAKMINGG
jgi:hypothetical protein